MGPSFNNLACNEWQIWSSTFGTGYPEHPLEVYILYTTDYYPVISYMHLMWTWQLEETETKGAISSVG
jgi:hypothetical protein